MFGAVFPVLLNNGGILHLTYDYLIIGKSSISSCLTSFVSGIVVINFFLQLAVSYSSYWQPDVLCSIAGLLNNTDMLHLTLECLIIEVPLFLFVIHLFISAVVFWCVTYSRKNTIMLSRLRRIISQYDIRQISLKN